MSLYAIGLSFRTVAALENNENKKDKFGNSRNIRTVADLLSTPPADILAIPNLGHKTLQEIYNCLAKHGFKLPGQSYTPTDRDINRQKQANKLKNICGNISYAGPIPEASEEDEG